MKIIVPIFNRTGGGHYSGRVWSRIATAIESATQHKADVRAVARAVGCTDKEADTAARLVGKPAAELAASLAAAIARMRRRTGPTPNRTVVRRSTVFSHEKRGHSTAAPCTRPHTARC